MLCDIMVVVFHNLVYIGILVLALLAWKVSQVIIPPNDLRQIPSVSILTSLGSLLKGESHAEVYHKYLRAKLQEHGIVRVNIFDRGDPKKSLQGSSLRYYFGEGVLSAHGENWKRQRRLLTPAFRNILALKTPVKCCQRLIDIIDYQRDCPIDVLHFMRRTTMDILGLAIFDIDFQVTTDGENEFYTLYSEIVSDILNPLYLVLPFVNRIHWPARIRALQKIDQFESMLADIIIKKCHAGEQLGRNLVSSLIRKKKGIHYDVTAKEIRDAIHNILFAGHDTTANALSILLCHTALHRDIQGRARQETLGVFYRREDFNRFTEEKLSALPYSLCVIIESMRLEPVVSAVTSRNTTRSIQLGRYHIPQGTKMGVHIYAQHHDPKFWTGPEEFRPERFSSRPRKEGDEKPHWIPFAMGPHQCLGTQFALREIRVIFAMLLFEYEWYLPSNSIHHSGVKTRMGPVTSTKDLYICFKKRVAA
ncbi:hypothetical protein IWQ61_003816 [Dispira simplex]|nr:hypothetical protein IWQ61_003816 [Dispira simplex]